MNLFSSVHWDTPRGVLESLHFPSYQQTLFWKNDKMLLSFQKEQRFRKRVLRYFQICGLVVTNVRNQLDTRAWAMGRDLDCHCCLDTQWSYRAAWVPSWRGTSFISTLDPDQYQIKRKKAAPFIFVVPRWVVIKNKYYRSSDKHFIIIISQQLSLKWNAYILLGST